MSKTTHSARIALVTGGSRGLGKSMALYLADHGDDVIITYVGKEADAKAVVAAIEEKGRAAAALQLDVGVSKTFAAFADAIRGELSRTFGKDKLDILVNNAGNGLHKPFAETTEDEFDSLMNIHLKGVFFLTQKLLPILSDGGRILNVSSGLTRFSIPGTSAYGAMKGGVEVLTRYLAKELAARQITVNTLAPGAIATDFNGGNVRDNEQVNKFVAGVTALGRVGVPDDIGGAAAMLLAPESRWMTGQRVEISGGMFL